MPAGEKTRGVQSNAGHETEKNRRIHVAPLLQFPAGWKFGEMYDLAGLIAPRPFFMEAGTYDPIFPIEAVKKSIEKTRAVYAVFGESRQVELDLFEGRHSINGRGAYDFLMEKLSI